MLSRVPKLLLLTLLLAANHSAQAQLNNHEGLYLGTELGYYSANDAGKEYELDGMYNGWEQDLDPQGSSVGILAGYNWRIAGSLMLGVEASYKIISADDSVYQIEVATGLDCTPGSDCTFSTEVDATVSMLGRLGYLLNGDTLAYVVLGYTQADLARSIHDGWNQQTTLHYDTKQNGETFGFGMEFMRSATLGFRLDYRNSKLGTHTYVTPAFGGVIEKQDLRQSELSLGLNYHF